MKTPNAELAAVDIRKLRDYCLNPIHDEGKHKARLFASVLGMTSDDAKDLQNILSNEYGQRYMIDFELEWHDRKAMIRSGWIIEHNSEIPRLTTCFPL
jgi:hypothetical protein